MKKGHIFLISGPSGVGKSSTINLLLTKHPEYVQIPSYTTRPVRSDDQETNARVHVNREEFGKLIKLEAFVDWVEYSHHLYGKKKSDIQKVLDNGKVVLLDADYRGVDPYRKQFPFTTHIFMKYRNLADLKERLRINRPDSSEEELERRYQIAAKEMESVHHFDYVIDTINGKPELSALEIEKIINSVLANQPSNQI